MSMKDAVLGLVVERPGYGYDLIRRFNERFGAAWRLNNSTVYAALDALEIEDLVVGRLRGRPRDRDLDRSLERSRTVIYESTPAGKDKFLTWLTAPVGKVEPLRAAIFLKIGLTTKQEHALALLRVIDAQIDACTNELATRLAAYGLDLGKANAVRWEVASGWYIKDAGISRLQADLVWLRRVREGAEAFRVHGVVPLTALTGSAWQ
jgi:DNA-binding PadR family transcriptional regulator